MKQRTSPLSHSPIKDPTSRQRLEQLKCRRGKSLLLPQHENTARTEGIPQPVHGRQEPFAPEVGKGQVAAEGQIHSHWRRIAGQITLLEPDERLCPVVETPQGVLP